MPKKETKSAIFCDFFIKETFFHLSRYFKGIFKIDSKNLREERTKVEIIFFHKKNKMKSIYPDLNVEAGIYSPSTGIIDVPELISAIEGDIQNNHGLISFNTKFIEAQKTTSGFEVSCNDGNNFLINTKYFQISSLLLN